MASNVFGIAFDAQNAETAATFWAAALGGTVADGSDGDNAIVETPGSGVPGSRIGFHRVSEPKTVKNRMHLDLITGDFAAEVERLTLLGATQLNEVNAGAHWITFADPEGNEFDLIQG
jgi:predicted enzyme related to lactoylglutathione lyase